MLDRQRALGEAVCADTVVDDVVLHPKGTDVAEHALKAPGTTIHGTTFMYSTAI